MILAPVPADDQIRVEAVKRLGLLDTAPEIRFDRITNLAALIFGVPISTITLIDSNREWFKSVCGLPEKAGERAISFCGHALFADEILLVPDALLDDRFKDNPIVTSEPFIRFYAGVPLFSQDGQRVGTFCIKDRKPRTLTPQEIDTLKAFAQWAEVEMNAHDSIKKLESNRMESSELTTFFKISDDIMAVAGLDGFFKRINPAFTELTGYSEAEILLTPFLKLIHPDDVAKTTEEVDRLSTGVKTIDFTNRYHRKDGEYVALQWNVAPHGGNLFAVGRDITEQQKLKEKVNYFASLVEQSTDAIIIKDLSGVIKNWNPAATTLYGYTSAEAVGENIRLIVPKEYDTVNEILDRVKNGERLDDISTVRRHKNGNLINVSVSIGPIMDTYGKVVAVSVMARKNINPFDVQKS